MVFLELEYRNGSNVVRRIITMANNNDYRFHLRFHKTPGHYL
jgi:hypothetical protein